MKLRKHFIMKLRRIRVVRRKIEENFWASFMDIGYFESLFGAIMGLMWFERDCSLNKLDGTVLGEFQHG